MADEYERTAVEQRRRVSDLLGELERRLLVSRFQRFEALARGMNDESVSISVAEEFNAAPFSFLAECVAVGFIIGKLATAPPPSTTRRVKSIRARPS